MTKEAKLGFFILIALGIFMIAMMLLGDITLRRGYHIHIVFSDLAGLPSKAHVKIAGVNVGRVKKVTLEGGKAKLTVWIESSVRIHSDAQARIIATGIIGSKYLELTSGSPDKPPLKEGDTIIGIDPVSIDRMLTSALESLQAMAESFQPKDGRALGENISDAVRNIKEITETLRTAVHLQEKKVIEIVLNIHSISKRINSLSANLNEIIGGGKVDLQTTIANLKNISEKLDRVVTSIDSGEGMAGKLIKDRQMGEELKETVSALKETSKEARRIVKRLTLIDTHWDVNLRYNTKYSIYHPDVGIRISPSLDKYYYFGGRNLGEKRKPDVYDPEKRNTIDFHVGRTSPYGSIYGGVIRNKFGVGVTGKPFYRWQPFNKFEVKLEVYDFFRYEPVSSPKVTIGGKINLYRFISVGGEWYDLAYEKNRNFNVYANLFMKDDDIGYLLGLIGLARP